MKKMILVFLMLLGNINACVDEQILAWEKVYDSFHTGQANWKETHVPELFDRIHYMAEYVKKAIKDSPERLNSLETILIESEKKQEEGVLTFRWAIRAFDALARICDRKIQSETQTGELPKSYFEREFESRDAKYSFLKNSDLYFLCVPGANLKIERFVDGYLRRRPVQFVALANKEPDHGAHGNYYKDVYAIYHHDVRHAIYFITIGGRYFEAFWPAYNVIKNIRRGLRSFEKNIVDPFLLTYFHEVYANAYKFYKSSELSSSITEAVTEIITNTEAFKSFIDNMELSNRRFDMRINLDATGWGKKDSTELIEHIASGLQTPYHRGIRCRLRQASKSLVENYLHIISKSGEIEFFDILEVFNEDSSQTEVDEFPCRVSIRNIASTEASVEISTGDEVCSYKIYGPGHIASHYFQDVKYLLKQARFISDEDFHTPISIYNYSQVRDCAISMRSSAVGILKREFEKSHTDIEMIRKKSATEIIKTLISLLE